MSHYWVLFVGDLHPCVRDGDLLGIFSTVGPVISAHVVRDACNGLSLGYGYVKTWNINDAKRMLDILNFYILYEKPMRIMWCQPDPTLRNSGVGNVYIKHLTDDVSGRTLYDIFSKFGSILSCKIQTNSQGKSMGFGFVHFDTQEAADEAILRTNGTFICGRSVYVCRFQSRQERRRILGIDGVRAKETVFVKNFGQHLDDASLYEMFAPFGEIARAKVFDANDQPKGFGFVCFVQSEAAQQAIAALNGSMVNGNKLSVCEAVDNYRRVHPVPDITNQNGCHVYIGNLTSDIDEEFLETVFSEFGEITSTRVMRSSGVSRGSGFVSFANAEDANRAIRRLDGTMLKGKKIYVTKSSTRAERRKWIFEHYLSPTSAGFAYSVYNPAIPSSAVQILNPAITDNQTVNAGVPNTQMSAHPNGACERTPVTQVQLEIPQSLVFHNSGQSGQFQQQLGQVSGQQAPIFTAPLMTSTYDARTALCYPWSALMATQSFLPSNPQVLRIGRTLEASGYLVSGQQGRYNIDGQVFHNRDQPAAIFNGIQYIPAYPHTYGFPSQGGTHLQTMDCQNISEPLSRPPRPATHYRTRVQRWRDNTRRRNVQQPRSNHSLRQTAFQANTQSTTSSEQTTIARIMPPNTENQITPTNREACANPRDDPLRIFCLNLNDKSVQEQITLIRENLVQYVALANEPLATEVSRRILRIDHNELLSLVRDRRMLDNMIRKTLCSLLSHPDAAEGQYETITSTNAQTTSENDGHSTTNNEPSPNLEA